MNLETFHIGKRKKIKQVLILVKKKKEKRNKLNIIFYLKKEVDHNKMETNRN